MAAILLTAILALGCKDDTTEPGTNADNANAQNNANTAQNMQTGPDAGAEPAPRLAFQELDLPGQTEGVTNLHFIPGRSEFIVLEKNGRVLHYALDGDEVSLLDSDTLDDVYAGSDCGLVSAAFDPDFETNNFVYFGYCDSFFYSTISRHEFDLTDLDSTGAEIIRVGTDDAPEAWHNVGSIGFDPDGNMWALFGEKKVDSAAQDLDSNLGSLLRIIPNRDPQGSGYEPAPGNPYADGGGSPDIYAAGLRSPWKGFLDDDGRYWVGDVGAATWEELDIVSEPGQNFGWPACEGRCEEARPEFVEPISTWNRSSESDYALDDLETEPTDRRVVWAGAYYPTDTDDPYDDRLDGIGFFGDFCAGWVRGMKLDSNDPQTATFDANLGHLSGVTGVDIGPDGHLYFVTYGNCKTFPLRAGRLWRATLAE